MLAPHVATYAFHVRDTQIVDVDSKRLLVVDDDRFTASLLAESLALAHWRVLGPAHNATDALSLVADGAPPVAALLDLDLGSGPDGIDLSVSLRQRFPNIGIVLLTAYRSPRMFRSDPYHVPVGVRFVSKAEVKDIALLDAELRAATVAPHAVNPGLLSPVMTTDGVHLTDRQISIMRLVADGLSNAAVAQRLGIAEASVEKAVARLIKRLGLSGDSAANPRVLLARAYDDIARPRPG